MPDVHVSQSPLAVYMIVSVIALAAVLALAFASPWLSRVPRAARHLAPTAPPPAEIPRDLTG